MASVKTAYQLQPHMADGADAAVFTLQNKCEKTIWPGILSGSGHPLLMNGGLELKSGDSINITAPDGWSGRFWGCDRCSFDQSGKGNCTTGDCGGVLHCAGAGGTPPASLAKFTLGTTLPDFYDVSLVDGYNIPLSIVPHGSNCSVVRCLTDLNLKCPTVLQVKRNRQVVACMSACMAFNKPEYCCSGAYNNPKVCQPTDYSRVFKAACLTDFMKLDRFDGTNFTRWQDKMMFLLTALKVQYVLDPNLPPLPEITDNNSDETKAARKKREEDELVCRGHILNALLDRLYDLFTLSKCPKEIWKALENKYNNEKQGVDKFLTLKYFEFTMNDSESVLDQVHQLQILVSKLKDLKVE
ncbi:hypothetical protein RJ639_044153, partial [Escallonia herrerae]